MGVPPEGYTATPKVCLGKTGDTKNNQQLAGA